MTSKHYNKGREKRENLIKNVIGEGKPVQTFKVDRGHRNGAELHTITTTGIIIVRNAKTKKVVTKLIARPNQIKRYFDTITDNVKQIIEIAFQHTKKGYNYF